VALLKIILNPITVHFGCTKESTVVVLDPEHNHENICPAKRRLAVRIGIAEVKLLTSGFLGGGIRTIVGTCLPITRP
jgi:hypothetical protein